MISQVTFTVEHSEDTDGLQDFIDNARACQYAAPDADVLDYTVCVDVDPDSI